MQRALRSIANCQAAILMALVTLLSAPGLVHGQLPDLILNPAFHEEFPTLGDPAPDPVVIDITASDGSSIAYTTNLIFSGYGDAIEVTGETAGTTPGQIEVHYDPAGVAPNTVSQVEIVVSSAGASNSPVSGTYIFTIFGDRTLATSPTELDVNAVQGEVPVEPVQVFAVGSHEVELLYWTSATEDTGSDWLSVAPASGISPDVLTVTFNTGGLSPNLYTGTIELTDTAGFATLVPVSLNVSAAPPVIADIANHSTPEGSSYTGPTPFLLQGSPTITWSLDANPSGMTINSGTGVVSWPSPTSVGSPHTVTIRATNTAGFDTETWQLTVTPPSVPPIISAIGDDSVQSGTPYTGPTPALDQGTLPVTWSLVANPSGMTINSGTGVVSWANPVTSGSPHTVTIRATNVADHDDESWSLTVTPPPVPPIINAIGDDSVQAGTQYTGPTPSLTQGTLPVTWSLIANPSGMTINSGTGVVSWANPVTSGSPHTVTIRATNVADHDDESWLLTVTPAPVPPIISAIGDDSVQAGTPYTGPTPALDQGTLPVTWSLVANPSGMTINSGTGVVSWANPVTSGSPHTITIRATNVADHDDESWSLTVTPAPQPKTRRGQLVSD